MANLSAGATKATDNQLSMLAMRVAIVENPIYVPGYFEKDDKGNIDYAKDYSYYAFKDWTYTTTFQLQYYFDIDNVTSITLNSGETEQSSATVSFNGAIDTEITPDSNWLLSQDEITPLDAPGSSFAQGRTSLYNQVKQVVFDTDDETTSGIGMSEIAEKSCNAEFTNINAGSQTRDFNNITYVRDIINVQMQLKHYNITDMGGFTGLILQADKLTGTINDADVITVTKPSGASNFLMVSQTYSPFDVSGSKFIIENRNFNLLGKWEKLNIA